MATPYNGNTAELCKRASEHTGREISVRDYGCPQSCENYHVFVGDTHFFAGTEYECRIYLLGLIANKYIK